MPPDRAAMTPDSHKRQLENGQWQYNNGSLLRIPKAHLLAFMYGSLPERMWDAMYRKDTKPLTKNLGESIANVAVPPYMPQALVPVKEYMTNKSGLTGGDVIPAHLKGLRPEAQVNPFTSDTAVLAGKAIRAIPGLERQGWTSPIVLQNTYRQAFGGVGDYALAASDAVLRGLGLAEKRVEPTPKLADRFVFRRFVARDPSGGGQDIRDFYKKAQELQQDYNTFKRYGKKGKTEEATRLLTETNVQRVDSIVRRLNQQYTRVRDIWEDNKLTPAQKRDRIDDAYLVAHKIAQEGNKFFEESEKRFNERKKAQ
jgi:hypothetical protein